MPIQIDKSAAKSILEDAIELALSEAELPKEWYDATKRISSYKSNATFVFALGTALLAKAVDERVDPLALKASGDGGYSARGLGHDVLRPVAYLDHGIHLGVTGREPLNNQPFFRYDRIDKMGRVKNAVARDDLVSVVQRVNDLFSSEALTALAAYLRQRIHATEAMASFLIASGPNDLLRLAGEAADFVQQHVDGGRTGQAFVAAGLDLVFEEVITGRINDPSVRRPGDIQALDGGRVVLAVEVRQKLSSPEDVTQFALDLRDRKVQRGMFTALGQGQDALASDLRRELWQRYNVYMTVHTDPEGFLLECIGWSDLEIAEVGDRFSARFLERLTDLEANEGVRQGWHELLRRMSV